jgi:glycosyltransferase involved in cell wall biosynthesis
MLPLLTSSKVQLRWQEHYDAYLGHLTHPIAFLGQRPAILFSSQGIAPASYYERDPRSPSYPQVVRWYRYLSRRVDVFAVWTEAGRRRLISELPFLEDRIIVLPPPIKAPSVPPTGARATGRLRVVFVGYDGARKGLDVAFEAMLQTICRGHDIDATLISSNTNALSNPYPGNIKLLPPVDSASAHRRISAADVLILPSRAETYGVVVVEAMMNGVVPIVSDVEPLPEVVGSGGIVVPVDDVRALADAVIRLETDSGLLARLSHESRSIATRRNGPEVVSGSLCAAIDLARSHRHASKC